MAREQEYGGKSPEGKALRRGREPGRLGEPGKWDGQPAPSVLLTHGHGGWVSSWTLSFPPALAASFGAGLISIILAWGVVGQRGPGEVALTWEQEGATGSQFLT